MLHFEANLSQPTVQFCVPDLDAIADQDENPSTEEAIIQMNALVLGVAAHFPDGLKLFRRLSEDDESILEKDILRVGAGEHASVKKTVYANEYILLLFLCMLL